VTQINKKTTISTIKVVVLLLFSQHESEKNQAVTAELPVKHPCKSKCCSGTYLKPFNDFKW